LMYTSSFIAAIFTNLITQVVVDSVGLRPILVMFYRGGFLVPLDLAVVILVAGAIYIAVHWEENYGDKAQSFGVALSGYGAAFRQLRKNLNITLLCGAMAFYESAMHIFIFNWTPVLSTKGSPIPHGVVFSSMMMCAMAGSSSFNIFERTRSSKVLVIAMLMSACAMVIPGCIGVSPEVIKYNFFAFLLFEFCIGIYFPAVSKVRSEIVAEVHRACMYNLFRVPMNALVIIALLVQPELTSMFATTFGMLVAATMLMTAAHYWTKTREEEPLLISHKASEC